MSIENTIECYEDWAGPTEHEPDLVRCSHCGNYLDIDDAFVVRAPGSPGRPREFFYHEHCQLRVAA